MKLAFNADVHRYWLDEHGPLVRSVADAIGAVRYVQSHTVSPELNAFLRRSRTSAEPYDGITEVWWESLEAVHAGLGAPGSLVMGSDLWVWFPGQVSRQAIGGRPQW